MSERPPSVDSVMRAMGQGNGSARARSKAAREAVAECRERGVYALADVARRADEIEACGQVGSLRPVINMSGIVLHTGLGRARLGATQEVATCHTNLELDLETGQRGDRQVHVRKLLCGLAGAEDALVVNNCAAAVFLTLRALCADRDVVLSRGQMVEIGGSFRMPDIVREAGCTLVEVGCTNKTRLEDYERVTGPETGAVLRCHPSNFRIVGFTAEPTAQELAVLAHGAGTILVDDVGHGCLIDLAAMGLPRERTLREAVEAGADIVLASGDKLIGGPQAGLILGRASLVRSIAKHPLARAIRIDKLSLFHLEQTLRLYADGLYSQLPVWQAVTTPLADIKRAAQKLAKAFPGDSAVLPCHTQMGGGSLPGAEIPTWCAALRAANADELASQLRALPTPVVGRIQDGSVYLDPRTATPAEVATACHFLRGVRLP